MKEIIKAIKGNGIITGVYDPEKNIYHFSDGSFVALEDIIDGKLPNRFEIGRRIARASTYSKDSLPERYHITLYNLEHHFDWEEIEEGRLNQEVISFFNESVYEFEGAIFEDVAVENVSGDGSRLDIEMFVARYIEEGISKEERKYKFETILPKALENMVLEFSSYIYLRVYSTTRRAIMDNRKIIDENLEQIVNDIVGARDNNN